MRGNGYWVAMGDWQSKGILNEYYKTLHDYKGSLMGIGNRQWAMGGNGQCATGIVKEF